VADYPAGSVETTPKGLMAVLEQNILYVESPGKKMIGAISKQGLTDLSKSDFSWASRRD
jgi:hypothetical protein